MNSTLLRVAHAEMLGVISQTTAISSHASGTMRKKRRSKKRSTPCSEGAWVDR